MTVQVATLVEAKFAENAETTQYTSAPSVRTIIDKYSVTNVTGSSAQYTARAVPSGQSAGSNNAVISARAILPGETYNCPEMVGQILEPGDFVSTLAGTASALVHRISGRKVS